MADSILHRQKKHTENRISTWGTCGGFREPQASFNLEFEPQALTSYHFL